MARSASGSAISMKPKSTGSSPATSRMVRDSAQNSSTPSASRLPWPTTSSAGGSSTSHVLVRRDRVQVGHANPRTAMVAATATAGSASAAAHASGRAGASRPVAGMRPS